jgi:hypothetical protein
MDMETGVIGEHSFEGGSGEPLIRDGQRFYAPQAESFNNTAETVPYKPQDYAATFLPYTIHFLVTAGFFEA